MHNVGGSDHLPVSLHMKRGPTSTQHPHQSLLRWPPAVLSGGVALKLYLYSSSHVQQAITNGSHESSA
jgi:hypothetical protein